IWSLEVVEDLDVHYLHIPVDADHARKIITYGPDGAGRVRAVYPGNAVVYIGGIGVVKIKVPSIIVVNVSIAVVIDAVVRYLAGVRPHIGRQIGVRVTDARIDIGNNDI